MAELEARARKQNRLLQKLRCPVEVVPEGTRLVYWRVYENGRRKRMTVAAFGKFLKTKHGMSLNEFRRTTGTEASPGGLGGLRPGTIADMPVEKRSLRLCNDIRSAIRKLGAK